MSKRKRSRSTAFNRADGSCDTVREGFGLIGDRADTAECNRGSTLDNNDVAARNAIGPLENTARAADDVIAAVERVFETTRCAGSLVAVESPALQVSIAPDIGTGETSMNVIKTNTPADESQAAGSSEIEGQLREGIHSVVASTRNPQEEVDTETSASSVNTLLQRIAGSTFKEIDRLIEELYDMRSLLQTEGQKVQRELVKYAQLSQAAMKSTRMITKGLSRLQDNGERAQYDGH